MIIIGVTGSSGSGKSTVSTIIKNNSKALVINADEVAKSIMVPGSEYYDKTVEIFGDKILQTKPAKNKGKIHKPTLCKELFSDDKKREKMNALTFKFLGKEIKRIILENKDKELIVLDVPLLYESGFNKVCNYVIAVVSEENTKINRIMQRDKINRENAKRRLDTQKTDEFFRENADFVIENNEKTNYLTLVRNTIKIIHEIKDNKKA